MIVHSQTKRARVTTGEVGRALGCVHDRPVATNRMAIRELRGASISGIGVSRCSRLGDIWHAAMHRRYNLRQRVSFRRHSAPGTLQIGRAARVGKQRAWL